VENLPAAKLDLRHLDFGLADADALWGWGVIALVILMTAQSLQMIGAHEAAPIQVMPESRLSVARPATSWSCNFFDAAGKNFSLEGRFAEAPVGWDPANELATLVKGEVPALFLGIERVKVMESTPEVRRHSAWSHAPQGARFDFNFQFVRGLASLATVMRYSPPSGGKSGTTRAFAVGNCQTKFHAVGEKEVQ
jgi:hypothetical protein